MAKFRVTFEDTVFDQVVEAESLEHATEVAHHMFGSMSIEERRKEMRRINTRTESVFEEK